MINTNTTFSGFILLDPHTTVFMNRSNNYRVSGMVIFPINSPIPVIVKGEGCIGIASVSKFTVDATSTTITFTLEECSKEASKVFYNLYKNYTVGGGIDADDPYSNTDQLIPGAMLNPNLRPRKKRSRDIFDDDDY